jgi:nitrite reductase/ring-hydroxylating ferredoxin subunit
MAKLTKVADTTDLAPGQGKVVTAEGKLLALFNVDGTFYAMDNTCVHRGGPLGEGDLEDREVICPWHGWRWDVTTGQNTMNAAVRLSCYPVRIDGTSVLVEL